MGSAEVLSRVNLCVLRVLCVLCPKLCRDSDLCESKTLKCCYIYLNQGSATSWCKCLYATSSEPKKGPLCILCKNVDLKILDYCYSKLCSVWSEGD